MARNKVIKCSRDGDLGGIEIAVNCETEQVAKFCYSGVDFDYILVDKNCLTYYGRYMKGGCLLIDQVKILDLQREAS